MKVSINTTYAYMRLNLNYGSILQCYALQRVLSQRGHTSSVVRDIRSNPKVILRRMKNIRYPACFFAKLSAQNKAKNFIRRQMKVSPRIYYSYASLQSHCPEADIHIAGSDQIWRKMNKSRFLAYVPDNVVKLSYAASFGRREIPNNEQMEMKKLLSRFDGISVREETGLQILQSMGIEGQMLLDPTLLLDSNEYPVSSVETNLDEYAYCYFVNVGRLDSIPFVSIQEYVRSIGARLRITSPNSYPLFAKLRPEFPSVEDWLSLYKNAKCIITNTYHGLLFSIIFKKNFLVCLQGGGLHPENDRFITVMNMLGLRDRVISSDDSANDISKKMEMSIDYERIYGIIHDRRKETEEFFLKHGL